MLRNNNKYKHIRRIKNKDTGDRRKQKTTRRIYKNKFNKRGNDSRLSNT